MPRVRRHLDRLDERQDAAVEGRAARKACEGSETEDEHERFVDGAELARVQPPGRPTESLGSTTVVCSTRTRVSWPSTVIVGRKLAGRAFVDVESLILEPV
jgi:hypothetical protein